MTIRNQPDNTTHEPGPLPQDASRSLGAMYFRELRRRELLTAEDEISLAQRREVGKWAQRELDIADDSLDPGHRRELEYNVQDGQEARQLLIECNLRLVVSIARHYRNRGLSLLDLIQEGNIGLQLAVDKYDWRRGFRFSTCAYWWIRQAMTRALAEQSRTIRLPVHVVGLLGRVARAQMQIQASTGTMPTDQTVAETVGMEVDRVVAAQRVAHTPVSIEANVGVDSNAIWGDLLPDDQAEGAAQREIEREELSKCVVDALERLDPRERKILEMRFGLAGAQERSLEKTAELLGISRERVRQIEQAALGKLRRMPRLRDDLLAYVAA